jgi:hypothetical protein
MIINDKDALKRLESPMNLINKLKSQSSNKKNAMSLFIPTQSSKPVEPLFNPFQKAPESLRIQESQVIPEAVSPKVDEILENSDAKIKLGLAHDKALDLLTRSVDMLAGKLEDVKADKLPAVVGAASKVVESIRRERNEAAKNNKDREVHYHFYTPQQQKVSDFEVIDVG